ncbi:MULTISPECIES: sulfite exporter TauE/SafE family protein [Chromobacterium]|uniref:sulfite exporter TauE/SafE family protein n=1 Tax=Chromobacterium TaxID=535 RepID=UPI0006541EB6|nr:MULTISPECIES: sulfite exporter TauE/SafE family protein [Chromobacterium]KMN82956.1 permease [Chromobacterium sp. LK11]MBN3002315.1 sulfite exporter TauE/SafE family protein [Chromobacterium alkanivorans]MCP1292166.1 sulfite exporter TauE/SafE family protein [Chromobacterium sp. S0633]MCS3803520.1 putative membrane protein YfcA [Chromobacterium alkanivorans]MCS3817370.1 putative membrane protein YfcA [Chromobacterium alkanivorans]
MLLDLPWQDLSAIFAAVTIAYVIFGVAGFGTALVASPVLAIFIPVAKIVPLLALMDMFAAFSNILRDGSKADLGELKRLIPLMVAGSLIGAAILLKTRPDALLLALGVFVVAYSLYSLSGLSPKRQFQPRAAVPFGLVGGVFSALFGSGGFIYAIYLSGRIEQKEHLRITQTTLIGLSTLTRVVLFALAGVYMDASLLLLALILAPAMLCGVFAGRHITLRLTREQFIRVINTVVLFSGIVLLGRYFSH